MFRPNKLVNSNKSISRDYVLNISHKLFLDIGFKMTRIYQQKFFNATVSPESNASRSSVGC